MSERMYRIGEAAELLKLKPSVLRFWETEFQQLAPLRTDKGQRIYTEQHLSLLRRIQQLLHEQGMTIDGARRVLNGDEASERQPARNVAVISEKAFLCFLREELSAMRAILAAELAPVMIRQSTPIQGGGA